MSNQKNNELKNANQPKVIFIDWNRTLSNSHFWDKLPDVEMVMFLANRDLLDPWMRGECSSEEVCRVIAEQVNTPYEVIFEKLKESCAAMEFVDNGLPQLIAQVRAKGVKVVLATDNMDCFSRFTVPALQLNQNFDGLLISCDLKIMKNDTDGKKALFFENYLIQNKLSYDDVVLLDDSPVTSKIYWQLGLPVVIINSKEKLIEVLQAFASDGQYNYE